MNLKNENQARASVTTNQKNASGRRVFVVDKVKVCAPVIDADEQQAYKAALRIAEAKMDARSCAPVIVADEVYA